MSEKAVTAPINKPERNYGVDLLRIVAMFMVVTIHMMLQGGILDAVEAKSPAHYNAAWLFEIAAYGSTNIYALISGYVGCTSKARASRIMSLKFQTSFWALIIVALFTFYPPLTSLVGEITFKHWFNALFPLMTNMYWYVTAFFGLYLFKPLLDLAINSISHKRFCVFIAGVFFFFLSLPMLNELINITSIAVSDGYNMLWLMILYIIGGGFRRFDTASKVPAWLSAILAIGSILFTWFAKVKFGIGRLVFYTSPTVFITSVFIFLIFSKIKIKKNITKKLISLFSAATLGVYLLHTNPLIWDYLMLNCMVRLTNYTWYVMVIHVLYNAFRIFTFCAILDIIRSGLFKLIGVDKLGKFIDKKVYAWLDK